MIDTRSILQKFLDGESKEMDIESNVSGLELLFVLEGLGYERDSPSTQYWQDEFRTTFTSKKGVKLQIIGTKHNDDMKICKYMNYEK